MFYVVLFNKAMLYIIEKTWFFLRKLSYSLDLNAAGWSLVWSAAAERLIHFRSSTVALMYFDWRWQLLCGVTKVPSWQLKVKVKLKTTFNVPYSPKIQRQDTRWLGSKFEQCDWNRTQRQHVWPCVIFCCGGWRQTDIDQTQWSNALDSTVDNQMFKQYATVERAARLNFRVDNLLWVIGNCKEQLTH
jgi:hypothetical protein